MSDLSTQPASGSNQSFFTPESTKLNGNESLDNHGINTRSNAPPVYNLSDADADTTNITSRVKVLWKDSTHQARVLDGLNFDVNISQDETSLFTIRYHAHCKPRDVCIRVLVCPEDIQSITSEEKQVDILLHFIMSKPPTLDIPPNIKPKLHSLSTVQSLMTFASLQEFTVCITSIDYPLDQRAQLSSLLSLLSRYSPNIPSAPATVEQLPPPPYHRESSTLAEGEHSTPVEPNRKRRLSSDSPSQLANKRISLDIKELTDHVNQIPPCRYDSEEREDILNGVDCFINRQLGGIEVEALEIQDRVGELEGQVAVVQEEVAEVRDGMGEIEEQTAKMQKIIKKTADMGKEVAKVLDKVVKVEQQVAEVRQEMKQMQKEMQKQEQSRQKMWEDLKELLTGLMSGAWGGGGNEKARVSFNAGSQASDNTQ
ncbi:hypothetical protein QBC44DRAFT_379232 [Cladorrhinum sp. PSN332]|nr:hypothetical protein QBC44DRAFT_379232 [Cladorrhinum sp. PSN332]